MSDDESETEKRGCLTVGTIALAALLMAGLVYAYLPQFFG